MAVRVGPEKWLSAEELMLLNYGAGERLSLLDSKIMKAVNPKGNQP